MSTIATSSVSVLNASYMPLGVTKMARAMALVINGHAVIEEFDETRPIRSVGSDKFYFPLVIRLLKFVNVPFTYAEEYFSRAGVLRRDNHTCGYCGKNGKYGLLMTHDHIIPRSRGGLDEWKNAITACTKCNSLKANRTPEEAGMPLLFEPTVPYRVYLKSTNPRKGGRRR